VARPHALVRFGGEGAAVRVAGAVERDGGLWQLRFVIEAAAGSIVVPPPAPVPARRDRLWDHTCCEAFVGAAGAGADTEVTLSPSGDWNVYRFGGYRRDMETVADASLVCAPGVPNDDGQVVVAATVDLGGPHPETAREWEVGLTAVIEHAGGDRSYWALAHPAAHPDFHHRAGFCLRFPGGAPAA
jgi:hypothetical protein